jgi:hypothetical protein
MSIPNYQSAANSSNIEVIEKGFDKWLKVYSSGALTNGAIKVIQTVVDYTDSSNPILHLTPNAPATETTESQIVGVVDNSPLGLATIPAGTYGFVKVRGEVSALCDGGTTDIAAGDGLEILNGGTAFVVGQAATLGVMTTPPAGEVAAVALEAYTSGTNVVKKVVLLGKQVQVKAA